MIEAKRCTSLRAIATCSFDCVSDVVYGCIVVENEVAENVIEAIEDQVSL